MRVCKRMCLRECENCVLVFVYVIVVGGCCVFISIKIMTNYHKPEGRTIQELKDIANKLRIHSVTATSASKSGYVKLFFVPSLRMLTASMWYG